MRVKKSMRIRLSDHFNYGRLLRFVAAPIVMMVFTSVYSVVDGLFVSNFVGKAALAAINLIFPLLLILGAVGLMLGTGGSALISKMIGEGESKKANRIFSMLVIVIIAAGALFTLVGEFFVPNIARLLGAEGEVYHYCVLYGRILLGVMPFCMSQFVFQSFFVTAEKSKLGLILTVATGVLNMVLDAVFVAAFGWGLVGAAAATAASQAFGGIFPLVYFARRNDSLLRFSKPLFDFRALAKSAANGSSEFLSNISASVVTILYNNQLMRLVGDDGVAAYGAIMYVAMIFLSVFMGFSVGVSPVVGYHYGAKDVSELKNLFGKSLVIVTAFGVVMTGLSEALASPLCKMFVGYDVGLYEMTVRGFRIYSFCFLLCGYSIFASGFFTALNNGLASAAISFLRTLVFQIAAVMLLPLAMGLDGVWCASIVAEGVSLAVSAAFIIGYRKRYGYMGKTIICADVDGKIAESEVSVDETEYINTEEDTVNWEWNAANEEEAEYKTS